MNYEDLAKTRREAAFGLVGTVKALVFIAKTSGMPIAPDSLDAALANYDSADAALNAFEQGRPFGECAAKSAPIALVEPIQKRGQL